MKLNHYYPKGSKPFLSLSALDSEDAISLMHSFASKTELVYKRFKDPKKYLNDRRQTEDWLRKGFIEKGGNPKNYYPIYFVLGNSPYVFEGYDKNCNIISINLDDIAEDQLSFTYPDSMVSRYMLEHKKEIYFKKNYHGIVFTKSEIIDLVDNFGLPNREWQECPSRKYDFFIEAQLWDKSLLYKS
ncbi:MAG: hypothetical protein KC646_17400 [Candidatus Cloacimonetes bacterium]|nr:hypothetical protein [Candidatus Cloacimonadota bacterium]